MIVTIDTQAQALSDLVGAGKAFDPATVVIGLASAIINNGQNTTLADITQAAGSLGNQNALLGWFGPYFRADGTMYMRSVQQDWPAGDSGDAQTIAGYYFAGGGGAGPLVGFTMLNPPLNVVYPYGSIEIIPVLVLGPTGISDDSEVWSDT